MLAPIFLLDFSIPDSLDFGVRYTPNTFKRGSSLFFTFTFTSPSRRLQRPNHQSPISKISRSTISGKVFHAQFLRHRIVRAWLDVRPSIFSYATPRILHTSIEVKGVNHSVYGYGERYLI
jgi:hypothetical protein